MARSQAEDSPAPAPSGQSLVPDATSAQAARASLVPNGSRFARRSNAQEDAQRRVHRQSQRPAKLTTEDAATRPTQKRNSRGGGSWGRAGHGRQFTVGNIGNNGRIYLRYVCCAARSFRLPFARYIGGAEADCNLPQRADQWFARAISVPMCNLHRPHSYSRSITLQTKLI
jgi:hypothetical protein